MNTRARERITLAGGCFWCMVAPFENMPGIERIVVGYTGGHTPDPTYAQVCTQETGHYEAVQIDFDPHEVTYEELLQVFWQQIDPTDAKGQFRDRGATYRTAIFYHNEAQKQKAEASKKDLTASGRFKAPITTKILPAKTFYPAETDHQDYVRKNPSAYEKYRRASGREAFIQKHWGKDKAPDLKERLTEMQYAVTQAGSTEPPFKNAYWNNLAEGIYVDVVSGEPLFSSQHKYDSGSGWPSFYTALHPENLKEKTDNRYGMVRTEVKSRGADSHLGHVFPDGPAPTGLRYCINSAALRFIPKEKLEEAGYKAYAALFKNP